MIKTIAIVLLLTTIANAKEIVVDNETDLMWQDSPNVVIKDWSGAKKYCKNLSLGGYDDWWLPNIDELMSISDKKKNSPSIKKIFENTKNNWYWSSTVYKNDSSQAWVVNFNYGYDRYNNKSDKLYVRCVRGGQ